MVVILLCLVGFVGAMSACSVPTDKTLHKECLPEADRIPNSYRNSAFFGRNSRIGTRTVRLEMRGWDAHQITTRLAEILLREMVGLDVVVQSFSRHAAHTHPCATLIAAPFPPRPKQGGQLLGRVPGHACVRATG